MERTRRWVHLTHRTPRSLHPKRPRHRHGRRGDGGPAGVRHGRGAGRRRGARGRRGRRRARPLRRRRPERAGAAPSGPRRPRAPAARRRGARLRDRQPPTSTASTPPSPCRRVDLASWRLRIGGRVATPVELTFAELLDRPLVERVITLNCVSNEVGGPYIGTARWLGVPLVPLLREAGIQAGADQLLARSVDGMTIGTPVAALLDGREPLLCVGMNGEPLPPEHGFPVRMLTPGLYGYVGACKWLTELEADHLRRRRRVLGGARLGPAGPGQDGVAHRPARPVHAARRGCGDRSPGSPGRRVGASGRSRCGSTTARGSRRRCCPCRRWTRGCSGATRGPPPPAPHGGGPGDRRHGRRAAEERVDAVPGRRHRLAHDHRLGRLSDRRAHRVPPGTPGRGRAHPAPCARPAGGVRRRSVRGRRGCPAGSWDGRTPLNVLLTRPAPVPAPCL